MPPHPKTPHLFEVTLDGKPLCAVHALSVAEARDFVVENRLEIKRLSPVAAFRLGEIGVPPAWAKAEYMHLGDDAEAAEVVDAEFVEEAADSAQRTLAEAGLQLDAVPAAAAPPSLADRVVDDITGGADHAAA